MSRVVASSIYVCVVVVGALVLTAPIWAYEVYSIDDDSTNCRFCHGDFRSNSYFSQTDGQNWGNLHDLHRDVMLQEDCDTCHLSGDEFPVIIGESGGGRGLAPIGCVGCHGRVEDGTGEGSVGYGTAMQRRHEAANVGGDQNGDTCFSCHAIAATTVPVGEDVLPPYYASPGVNHPNMPVDSCNPNGSENFAGAAAGIDNDGDFAADSDDSDCAVVYVSPGEASGADMAPLRVTDRTDTSLTISYEIACESTNHRIHFGPLSQVSAYFYTGTRCNLGTSGLYTWTPPAALTTLFFVVVADDGTTEGSYGLDSDLVERPSSVVGSSCTVPQDLENRCN